MVAQPHQHDPVERGVGLSVSTTIEAMADGLAQGRLDRRSPAQHREGGLGVQAVGVVASGDQQRPRAVLAGAEQRQELGCRHGDQPVEFGGEDGDLRVEGLIALGDGPQCQHRRGERARDRTWLEGGGGGDQHGGWQAAELLAQLDRGGNQQRLRRVDRLGAGPDRGLAGDPQRTDHLHLPGSGLRGPRCLAGLHRAGGGLSVGRVRLAVAPAGLAVGPVDLQTTWPWAARKRAKAAP